MARLVLTDDEVPEGIHYIQVGQSPRLIVVFDDEWGTAHPGRVPDDSVENMIAARNDLPVGHPLRGRRILRSVPAGQRDVSAAMLRTDYAWPEP